MGITVIEGDPTSPEATRLLKASHALMQSLFPAESNHYLSIDALRANNIHFFEVQVDGATMGCGALAIKTGYGEIKSMFVDPEARGLGLADAVLRRIESVALDQGLPILKLETGNVLYAAHKVYARHGYLFCGPFGSYKEHPDSLFMEKRLS
ncbi:GNAT family N-acetyltransferase [Donghicola tyrosinivorans]|uniref:Putative acetyltransferase n=1 Tax=Donghicola tyrosinivorans TaxID=1652492 RepID=A0A2T0WM61_9RHOB|nr:GNAT family N-acetyltransferase [Donghicola tyrosinivorans]PRY87786.1 putative acetyltransferase [Donghicola tyrosinivorans]